LINDLLRVGIDIFQLKKDVKVLCKLINSGKSEELLFSRGAFLVPFTGNEFKDSLIISVIYDYNQSHELSVIDDIKNEAYLLMEKTSAECDKLVEPKIVQHLGKSVRYGWPTYLEIADSGGFYNYEFLIDDETFSHLVNEAYNVYIWPYLPNPASLLERINTMFDIRETNAIRKFVYNGGGFIGTCYGAYAASSGFLIPGVINSLRLAYNPGLLRIYPSASLSISDSLMTLNYRVYKELIQVTNKIVKPKHPLFYDINGTINDFFKSPIFIWTGKNSEVLTVFEEFKTFLGDPINNSYTEKILTGKPGFINSKFGDGEVVLFSSHPDFVNNIKPLFSGDIKWEGDRYYGRRVIFNSFFYVTSEKNNDPDFVFVNNETFVNMVINKTRDLQISNSSNNRFSEIISDMDELFIKFTILNDTINNIIDLFTSFLEKTRLFPDTYRFFVYTSSLTDIFRNYINNSISSLNKLDKIITTISEYNDTVHDKVEALISDLNDRISNTTEIVDQVTVLSQKIEGVLESDKIDILHKIELITDRRELLSKFDIGIKYVPHLFFIPEKLLRDFWYDYEANVALS
jgi:hypothetical protein